MPRNHMPPGWVPDAPAWESRWDQQSEPLICAIYATQGPTIELDSWAREAFHDSSTRPLLIERGQTSGGMHAGDSLYLTYWRKAAYAQWWSDTNHSEWWSSSDRDRQGYGHWREVFSMPFERFETLHSSTNVHGVSVSADYLDGPVMEHGYQGGMRDRIPLTEYEDLQGLPSVNSKWNAKTRRDRQRVCLEPPKNMAVIRSGQNWSLCGAAERSFYIDHVHPVLLEGMAYLQHNPEETGCFSLRFLDMKTENWGATSQSCGLGYAVDVHAFEKWASSHPTHLAIFGRFMEMVGLFGEEMRLQLWHEVTSLDGEFSEFEYINCRPDTGLLCYV